MPLDGSSFQIESPVTQMLSYGRRRIELGWCQQSMRLRGSVCIIGSLPVDDFQTFTRAEGFILDAIDALGYSHRSVPEFNDDVGRTKGEILEVFNAAIALSKTSF